MSSGTPSHQSKGPDFGQEPEPNSQRVIKVSVFFNKKASLDYDSFFNHWQTVHTDLVVATEAFRKHIVRYAQHIQTPEMKERMRSLGASVLEYDACAQLWARTWDDWVAFSSSPEYNSALRDDCESFMELPMTYMVGHENLVVAG